MTAWMSVSGNLNTRWTLYEQQRELRSKCSEIEEGPENTFRPDVSCGENCTLLALFIFSKEMFKMCMFLLGHPVLHSIQKHCKQRIHIC
jgi:hypothetical protein